MSLRALRRAVLALAAIGLSACSERAATPDIPPAAPETRISISQGMLTGFLTPEGAHAWRGVPFAEPPVGPRRWRAPGPPPAFPAGALDALAHGPACPQLTLPLDQDGSAPGTLIGEEDCLVLDVYAPAGARTGDPLPVMVWIHGGGNVWGRASQYDGATLAQRGDVIVVVIQYRLGPLGFFAHETLRASAATPIDAAANFALLDMVAALDWVQAEIAAFGGDPDRVTIFGESAGGHNVAGLLASPLAAGKFHRAIIQSGSLDTVTLAEAQTGGARIANPSGEAVIRFAGEDADAETLRAASLEAVFNAYRGADTFLDLPRMIADGVTLPEDGVRAALADPSRFNAVPVITGATRDEARLFHALDERYTRSGFGLMYFPRGRDFYAAAAEYPSRAWRLRAVDDAARIMTGGGHGDVWAYRFDWDEGGRLLLTDFGFLFGAAHSLEIPFVFGDFDLLFGRISGALFNRANQDGRESLSADMIAYWSAFAHDGEPGGGQDRPLWARWAAGGAWMRFDSPAGGGPAMQSGEETEAAILADFIADDRFSDARRCDGVDALAWRDPALGAQAAEHFRCNER